MQRPDVLDQLATLSEETRVRLLLVLEAQELMVGELCQVLELPQSTVSRHLKQLVDQQWLSLRRDGTRSFYRLDLRRLDPASRKLWLLVRERVTGSDASSFDADQVRLREVLAQRRADSQRFFAVSAGDWQRLREELYGPGFDLVALVGLLEPGSTVGDLGCGSGELTALVAPFVERVIGVDASAEMLQLAGQRTQGLDNVELRSGQLENLPIADSALDVAVLNLVLSHAAEPERTLREASRALRPGGAALIVDLLPHRDDALRERLGHVWQGFSHAALDEACETAGLTLGAFHPLPPRPRAQGPALFAASARVPRVPKLQGESRRGETATPVTPVTPGA
ncbi:MAG: methyltransferase domain-containing protein [Acidobacteria bacterium]|nr:MAG: methyltransferase domain-containing protein [Acidobacteriota bacterium]REK01104.1 MAG: methyltransferase domain-containing protein [Acidobacteriota bacterium]